MAIQVKFYPPLNTAAGRCRIEISTEGLATVQDLINRLLEQYGQEVRHILFDNKGRIIPAWCVFINNRQPVHFNRPEALETVVADGDTVVFLLALAGG